MLNFVDYFLDRLTMYRLLLYYLIALLLFAVVGSLLGFISYSPVSIILSSIFLVVISYATNKIFSWVFKAPTNVESVYITALILACIVGPFKSVPDLLVLFWAGVLAMAA